MNIQFTREQLALRDELRAYFSQLMTPELAAEWVRWANLASRLRKGQELKKELLRRNRQPSKSSGKLYASAIDRPSLSGN